MNGGPLLGFCMDPRESKDSCCYLLVTFKVKESTIYFKGYRISSLLDQGGYSMKLLTLIERRARQGGTQVLGPACPLKIFLFQFPVNQGILQP